MVLQQWNSLDDALNLGARLLRSERYTKAVQCYEMIKEVFPSDSRVFDGLARSHKGDRNFEQMIANARRALLLSPNLGSHYYNFANGYRSFDRPLESGELFRRGLLIEPENTSLSVGLALTLLQAGHWEEGLELYELRESNLQFSEELAVVGKDIWRGEDLNGKTILLVAEQGLGDTLQFIRYATLLRESGAVVKVRCQEPLKRLLATVDGVAEISEEKLEEFDYASLMMSLPYHFSAKLDSMPNTQAYIKSPKELELCLVPTNLPKVGVVWSGNPKNSRNSWRSCPLRTFAKLFGVKTVEFFSLQKGWEGKSGVPNADRVYQLSPVLGDFADTATAIDQLDLIISVDTSVAHLAGAMGKPVWLLLSQFTDWRWLLDRENTPWYPNMRLFRAAENEAWAGLIDRVSEELAVFTPSP